MARKLTKVEESINESSEKIDKVKRIVKKRSSEISDPELIPEELDTTDWREKAFSHPENTIRLGTIFSGIGAIEHAFQRLKLNCEIVFAGDIDNNCKKSYFANYDIKEENWFSDVRDFDAKKYKGKVDIIVGGAPCQAFSMVGKRLGFEDARGTLFYEFARIVKETEPKVFIFENVKGLINHDKGRTWHVIHDIFEELGYKVNLGPNCYSDCGIGISNTPEKCAEEVNDFFTNDKCDVIISCGKALEPESLGKLPENVKVYPYVNQLDILARADVFISHCGMNSVSESLYMATPLVLYPQTGEGDLCAGPPDDPESFGVSASETAADPVYVPCPGRPGNRSRSFEPVFRCG